MTSAGNIVAFEFVAGLVASLLLGYLLYSETVVVAYRRFFRTVTVGLLVFALSGPLVGLFAPAALHAVHGLAALFVTVGLYDLVARELDQGEALLADDVDPDSAFDLGDDTGFEDD